MKYSEVVNNTKRAALLMLSLKGFESKVTRLDHPAAIQEVHGHWLPAIDCCRQNWSWQGRSARSISRWSAAVLIRLAAPRPWIRPQVCSCPTAWAQAVLIQDEGRGDQFQIAYKSNKIRRKTEARQMELHIITESSFLGLLVTNDNYTSFEQYCVNNWK